jgi:type IV pilus assembly protein PilC
LTVWKWEAVDENRITHNGIWEETSENLIAARLWKQKLYPVRIRHTLWGWLLLRRGAWNGKFYWSRTARKIGTLLAAGIPLLAVLDIIADKEVNLVRKSLWKKVSVVVQAGDDLSVALKGFTPPPGEFLEAMVRTGEKSGALAACFLEAAAQMEEEYFFEKKMKTALFYPGMLLLTALAVVYFLSIFVLPMYEHLFQELNAELPFISRMLFKAGADLPFLLGLAVIAAVIFSRLGRKRSWEIPAWGKMRKYKAVTQFCSVWERLLKAGVTLPESLILIGQIQTEREIIRLTRELKFAVEEGQKIAPVLAGSAYFPAEAAAMLGVAEESGRLDEMLGHTALIYKKELQERLEIFSRTIEPLLILGMAGLVGIVAIGVLLPVFDLSAHIQ